MLTAAALSKFREFIKKNMRHGRYKLGASFYTVPIHEVKIENDRVYVFLLIDHNAAGTITQCQLYDNDGDLFADKPDSITKSNIQGVLVRFSFLVKEV